MGKLEKKIEEEHGRTLTNRQRTFARHNQVYFNGNSNITR
jgi:hypothetical protein